MSDSQVDFEKYTGSPQELNELSYRSRQLWKSTPGYSDEYLEKAHTLISIDEAYLLRNHVWIGLFKSTGTIQRFGFFGLKCRDDQQKILDHLWIEPQYTGKGLGRLLFAKAMQEARALGWNRILIYADLPAEGFYLRMGAKRIGYIQSRIEGGPTFPALEMLL